MTIAASGQLVFPTELNTELRRSGALTMPDAQTRWLADRPSGALTFPTHFYGKSGYKYLGATSISSLDTSHSFSSTDFGPFYTGRKLLIIVEYREKLSAATSGWTCSSVSVGGSSESDASMTWFQQGAGSTVLNALGFISVDDDMTATSGTISFNSTASTRARCFVFSIANLGASTDGGSDTGTGTSLTISGGVDTGANGFIVAACSTYRAAGGTTNHSFSGTWDEMVDSAGSTQSICIAMKNRQSSGTKTVSCSWTGSANGAVLISAAV